MEQANSGGVYDGGFWLAYLTNALAIMAISMMVRYADFVIYLGAAEAQLGLIVGVGMMGSLLIRTVQGVGIDRLGPRKIWLWSLATLTVSLVGQLCVTSATGPTIYLLYILFSSSIAGAFGAAATHVSLRVPTARVAEILGMLGTSGFIGILVGPQLADWICGEGPIEREQLNRLFLVAAGLSTLAFMAAWAATWGQVPPQRRRRPPVLALLRRYHPGTVLLVAVVMGLGFRIPNTFLRPFAAELNIATIGLFFATYATTAFVIRIATRRLPEILGLRPLILLGLTGLISSMLLFLMVRDTWHLMFPGMAAGMAHAFLFPSVLAAGSTVFPKRYRGLGTSLVMSQFDLGSLIGAPAVGGMLHYAKLKGLPAYPTMFLCVAVMLTLVALVFFVRSSSAGALQANSDDA